MCQKCIVCGVFPVRNYSVITALVMSDLYLENRIQKEKAIKH